MMVFCVFLSGCMVSVVICFSVIVLKDRRLCDFLVVREVFFSEGRGMFGFGGVLAMVLRWFFGCFCCV